MDLHLNRLNLEWVDQGLAMDHLHYQKDRGMVLDQDLAMAPAQVLALVPALVLARAMVKARA